MYQEAVEECVSQEREGVREWERAEREVCGPYFYLQSQHSQLKKKKKSFTIH